MASPGVLIDGTAFGEITIAGKVYDSDVTVYWDGRVSYRGKEHVLEAGEFIKVMKSSPSVLVVGTGQNGVVRIAPEVMQMAEDGRVDVYAEPTPKAVKLFNAFSGQGKKVAGIFHVTC